jgi:NADPH2:quinone reductase
MQAVVCTEVGHFSKVLKLQDAPQVNPGKNQLAVRVLACGLAFPDVLTVLGKHISKPPTPFILGNEVCGQVINVGVDSSRFKVGDIVFGNAINGGAAQEALLDERDSYLVPDGVDPAVAAGFELNYGTTYHALVDIAELKAGETLLVLGASGGIGMSAIDIGKAVGAVVIACASTDTKLEFCRNAGADHCINYGQGTAEDLKSMRDQIKKIDPTGIDVVYDPVGGQYSEPALRSTGWGGRFVVCGFASGGETPKDSIPKMPLNLALLNERKILGVFWGFWKATVGGEINRHNITKMMEWVRDGKLTPVITKSYPLANYLDACDDLMTRKVIGKIVLDPTKLSSSM